MIQFIDAFYRQSARRCHLVYLDSGMRGMTKEYLGSPFQALRHHLLSLYGTKSHLYAGLHRGLHIFKDISDTTRSQSHTGFHLLLLNHQREAQFLEDTLHNGLVLLAFAVGSNEIDTLLLTNGGVGYHAEEPQPTLTEDAHIILEAERSRYTYQYLMLRVERDFL